MWIGNRKMWAHQIIWSENPVTERVGTWKVGLLQSAIGIPGCWSMCWARGCDKTVSVEWLDALRWKTGVLWWFNVWQAACWNCVKSIFTRAWLHGWLGWSSPSCSSLYYHAISINFCCLSWQSKASWWLLCISYQHSAWSTCQLIQSIGCQS